WSWGKNNYYQLGDNTMTQRSSPVQPFGNDAEGYFNLGIYFPSTLIMSEDTVATLLFPINDPDSNSITLTVSSSDQDILKDSGLKLITPDNNDNPLNQTVTAGENLNSCCSFSGHVITNLAIYAITPGPNCAIVF
ncbi:hypothetical protein MHK_003453, partial [Candidatus Magnetomorum sp. HK-1]